MPRKQGGKKSAPEELNRKNQLQAILLADSFTNTFRPVTREQPKVLLPICNVPMIDHTLEWLAANDVYEVFVMCCAHASKVRQYLRDAHIWNVAADEDSDEEESTPVGKPQCRHLLPKVHVVCIADSRACAGDVLRFVDDKEFITSDPFVVVSGDTVSNMNLGAAVDAHKKRRAKDKTSIMSLVFMPAKTSHPTREYTDDLVVAMNHSTQQILSFDNNMNRGTFGIGLDLLEEHAQMDFRYDLLDCNIDICSPEVLIQFSDNYDYGDIRRDYVRNEVLNKELGWKYFAYVIENEYAARVQDLCTYDSICRDMLRRWTYPLVPDSNIHGRTNFKLYGNGVFKEENVRTHRSVKLGPNVIAGSGCTIDRNVKVANATLGRNVKIGKNVSIVNSYIWDDVVIGDGCEINGAVICNGATIGTGCVVSPGSVVSFGVALPNDTNTPACSRFTNLLPEKDEFDDPDESATIDESLLIGPASNKAKSTYTKNTATILAKQRDDHANTSRRWTVNEWDIQLWDDEDDDEDSDDSSLSSHALEVVQTRRLLQKLHHTSINSDGVAKQRRWYTWEGVDLVALGYESESDDEDSISGHSVDGSEEALEQSGQSSELQNRIDGRPDPQAVEEAMNEIENMVDHAIQNNIDSIGLEVRAFMAAQNLQMGDAGAAVLRGFLHRADEAGDAAKNKIILALNNIMEKWTPLLLKFSSGYGEKEKLGNQVRLLHEAEGFARCRVLGLARTTAKGSPKPSPPQQCWRHVFPFSVKFLFQRGVVSEEAFRQYKMEREETTPTGAPEEDLFTSDQMSEVFADILDSGEDSDDSDDSSDSDDSDSSDSSNSDGSSDSGSSGSS